MSGPVWPGAAPRRRMFQRGRLRYVLLQLLAEQPRHGYELIRTLEERLGGLYAPSAGAVYPTLQLLEEMGCLTGSVEDGRKTYTVTDQGRELLAERQRTIDEFWEHVRRGWGETAGQEARQLRQEFRSLAATLMTHRLDLLGDPEKLRRARAIVTSAVGDMRALLNESEM